MASVDLPRAGSRAARGRALPARALWSAWNLLQLAFTLCWTAGLMPFALLAGALGGPTVPLRMAAWLWSPGLLLGAGVRFRVDGAQDVDWSRPYVIVANHASIIDICALFRAVPVPLRFLLKHEMTRVPLVGRYAKVNGMLFIDRGDRRAGAAMLREAVRVLREGHSLCVFPEGTRSRDGRIGTFKVGAFQAGIVAGVAVLPVAIVGAGAVLPTRGLFRVRPGPITVRFGAPLETADGDRQWLARQAQDAVAAMLERGP